MAPRIVQYENSIFVGSMLAHRKHVNKIKRANSEHTNSGQIDFFFFSFLLSYTTRAH